MTDTRTFFYPATAECQTIIGPYPGPAWVPGVPSSPLNSMGGYGGLLDVNDYNGTSGGHDIFIGPDAAVTALGIQDLMPAFLVQPARSWYMMRQVDFKNWIGVGGIFWKKTSFVMEVDILPATMPSLGGFRDEAINSSLAALTPGVSPYGAFGAQGSGIMLKAIITDPITSLEVVKDSHIICGANQLEIAITPPLSFPRQVVQLNLVDITPDEISTMVLRVETQQYGSFNVGVLHPTQDSTIYRIGLTPDPASLRSSGKQSAALTTR